MELATGANTIILDLEVTDRRGKRMLSDDELRMLVKQTYGEIIAEGGMLNGVFTTPLQDPDPGVLGNRTRQVLVMIAIK